jgi:putative inorganic carbon (hco3(-)) transporter
VKSLWRPFSPRLQLGWDTPQAKVAWLALAVGLGLALAQLPLTPAALVLVGVIVVLSVLIEPLVGLTLTLLLAPLGALENILLGGTTLNSGQLLLLLALGAWLAQACARRRLVFPRAAKELVLPWCILVGAATLSLLNAPSPALGLKEVVKWVQLGLVAWFAVDAATGRPDGQARVGWVVAAVLLAGLSQALIGIWQFGLRGDGPEHFEILGRFYRAYGTFEQPNPYAGFLGLSLALAIGVIIGDLATGPMTPGSAVKRLIRLRTLMALGTGLLIGVAMLMSWSRGGWLGAAAGLVAMAILIPRRRWHGLLLVAALALGGWIVVESGLFPAAVSERLTGFTELAQFQDVRGVDITPENYAVLERMAHWQAALDMANDHPWLGVGFGNYEAAYGDYGLLNWPHALGHAHNYYLNLLAEVGIVGLTAYLAFWAAVIWMTARIVRRAAYPDRGLALGLMGAWIHLATHQLVDKLFVNNIYLHLGALLGILILLETRIQHHAGTD